MKKVSESFLLRPENISPKSFPYTLLSQNNSQDP